MKESLRLNGSHKLLVRSNRSSAAQKLISQLKNAGWRVRDYPIDQSIPFARTDDGRCAEGFAEIRKEFIGYE